MTKDNRWAQLCALKAEAFNDPRWIWERKFDGDRMKAVVKTDGSYRLVARSGADKTAQFPELKFEVAQDCELDGELVSATGLSFQEFNQRRMNRTKDIGKMAAAFPGRYIAFDILSIGGGPVGYLCLENRKKLLHAEVTETDSVKVASYHYDGPWIFNLAKDQGWEGVVGKDLNAPYTPGRRAWVKVKVWLPPAEYYIIGFTEGTGKRKDLFGAMMIGEVRDGRLEYVCDCGSGPNDAELERLNKLRKEVPPYCNMALGERVSGYTNPAYWAGLQKVKVKAVEKTNDGSLRFPIYCGLVEEKHAKD